MLRDHAEKKLVVLLAVRERVLEGLEDLVHRRLLLGVGDLLCKEVEVLATIGQIRFCVVGPAGFGMARAGREVSAAMRALGSLRLT